VREVDRSTDRSIDRSYVFPSYFLLFENCFLREKEGSVSAGGYRGRRKNWKENWDDFREEERGGRCFRGTSRVVHYLTATATITTGRVASIFHAALFSFPPSFCRNQTLRNLLNFAESAQISAPSNWRFMRNPAGYVGDFRRTVYVRDRDRGERR